MEVKDISVSFIAVDKFIIRYHQLNRALNPVRFINQLESNLTPGFSRTGQTLVIT